MSKQLYAPLKIDYEMLGDRLYVARKQRRLTQEDVANLACISVSSVGAIEWARRKPSIEALAGLSCALDISLDFLILGIESRCAMERCPIYEETTRLLRYYGLDKRKR